MLELALLAIPAGIIGFLAAPCCGLLGPAYLPFVLNTTPAASPPPAARLLPLLDTPGSTTTGPRAAPGSTPGSTAAPPSPGRTPGRPGTLISFTAFAVGFCLFFTLLGMSASALGLFLLNQLPVLEKVAGFFIVAIGVAMITRLRFLLPRSDTCVDSKQLRRGIVGPFVMGLAMAVAWTPCTGPTLGAILALVTTTSQGIWQGGVLLFLYAVGLSIPFGLMALTIGKVQRFQRFQARHEAVLERVAGAIMIAVGVLILVGGWQRWLGPITSWLSSRGWPPI